MAGRKKPETKPDKKVRLIALLLVGLALFCLASLVSHDKADLLPGKKSEIHNWGGGIGAHLAGVLFSGLGRGAWLVPFILALFAIPLFRTGRTAPALRQAWPLALLLVSFLLLLPASQPARPQGPGGVLGSLLAGGSVSLVGTFGTYLAGSVLLLFSLAVLFREPFARLRVAGDALSRRRSAKQAAREEKKKNTPAAVFPGDRVLFNNGQERDLAACPLDNNMIFKAGTTRKELLQEFKARSLESGRPAPLLTRVWIEPRGPVANLPVGDEEEADDSVMIEAVPAPAVAAWDEEPEEAAWENWEEDTATAEDELPPAEPLRPTATRRPAPAYITPDSSLLSKSSRTLDEETRRHMQENARLLQNTFLEFGIEATVTNICRGPVITRFEMSIPPGVKLNRVVTLQDNIALNLAAASVRIEAPIPGKSAIGIEVPNKIRSMVTLRDILESEDFRESKALIPVALGQSVSGAAKVADLANMPHLIIAGTTGSGKSVCVNGIICSLLYNMTPEQVRLILVDPKYVELAPYNGIPHLLIPVINKPRAAIMALKWLVGEMERRYQLLQRMNSRNITGFNQRIRTGIKRPADVEPEEFREMPYLVVVIDELADLMILAKKEIEDSISRLAAMSRAVGIHLIFATQRPSVDVLTGVIKNNFPARIAFQVASSTDSRTILDANGADKLLGKGDSLFIGPGSPFPVRIQGAFLSEEEVDKTTEYLRSLGEPEYRMEILEAAADEEAGGSFDDFDDPLFKEAVEIVIATKRASASYLQRRLKVGYNRAARMVEMMEEEGIIGPQQGSRPREILSQDWNS